MAETKTFQNNKSVLNDYFKTVKKRDGRMAFFETKKIACAIFITTFIFAINVNAQEFYNPPGVIEGEGIHFEITDSEYLNIILDSSEQIKLRMESISEMITMMIEPVSSSTLSTRITLSGLIPQKIYYKYQDDYHNFAEFIADENGNYYYIQDISKPHFVFIQTKKSTKFIKNDATGGDCFLIGNWDNSTKTCTLTQDVNETIQIDDNNIVLDGNNYALIGFNTGYGIYLQGKSGNTIKNLTVENFDVGIALISLYSPLNNNLMNNIILNNKAGIYIIGASSGNYLTNNIITNNKYLGININFSYNNFVLNNFIQENLLMDINVEARDIGECYNVFQNNIGSGNRPIKYFNSAINLENEVVSQLILCDADNSTINNVIISGSTTRKNNGLFLIKTDYSVIKNSNSSDNYMGIFLDNSDNNILSNNNFSLNDYAGFFSYYSDNNQIENNYFFGNNYYGAIISLSNNNQIYNNNFINNIFQIYLGWNVGGNVFNLEKPIGGNYWSNFDASSEGCYDANNDNFCDSPYVFTGGQDNLPWIKQDGWKIPANQPPTISNINQYKSDGQTEITEGGITTESSPDNPYNSIAVLKATLNDPDNDQVKFQIELKEFNQPFDEQNLLESGFVSSGSVASITKYGLIDGQYHWRARAVDFQGNPSQWQEFGTAGNVDFEVKLPLSYKAANLAKELITYPYLWGGKGWDYYQDLFVEANTIKTGYNFYNASTTSIDFGAGVDCSGLIMWSYNRGFDSTKSRFNNFVKAEGADEQYRYNTTSTTESELKPGDVMFFDFYPVNAPDGFIDHVAIYVGENGGFDVVSAVSRVTGIRSRSKDVLKADPGFVAFKRVIQSPSPAVLTTAYSPVDLILTDPDGFTITPTTTISSDLEYLREIPGILYYSEMKKGADGNPIDQIYSYTAKTGDYIIKVIPATGVFPTETYMLDFRVGEQTTILAQDIPLSQIPGQGYGITVSATGTVNSFTPVVIDIKPDSYQNSTNLGSNGVVPVAIFGSATFDVRQIDPTTIKLANASAKLKGNGQPIVSYSNVNGDGFIDITVNITTEALQLTVNDIKANLEGKLFDGTIIKGSDSVRIVP